MADLITTTKKDIIWNYLATLFNIGYGIIILPLILHFLSGDEVGLNYLMLTISSLVALIDFGFSPQFGRNITYAISGAKRIEKEGLSQVRNSEPNYRLLAIVIEAAKYTYRRMSVFALLILAVIGTPYIYYVTNGFSVVENTLLIWLVFCISSYLNIYFIYYRSLLTGSGKIYESSFSVILSKSIYIILCSIMLFGGCGLFSVVVANLVAPIVQFLYSHIVFYTESLKRALPTNLSDEEIKEALSAIWYNAKKLGINSLGAFAILKVNLFLIGLFLPLSVVGSFGVLNQVVHTLGNVSSAMFNSFLPKISSLQLAHDYKEISRKLSFTVVLYWITLFVSGMLCILLLPCLLKFIGSSIKLPSMAICVIYLIVMLLEGNHSNFATVIATSNKVPFVAAGLVAGACITFFTYLSLRYTSLGLLGVVLVQGIVQLSYNNWKWPAYVLKDLKIGPLAFIRLGIIELLSIVKQQLFR